MRQSEKGRGRNLAGVRKESDRGYWSGRHDPGEGEVAFSPLLHTKGDTSSIGMNGRTKAPQPGGSSAARSGPQEAGKASVSYALKSQDTPGFLIGT